MKKVNLQGIPEDVKKYIKSLELRNESLLEELKLALFKKFGRKSEKWDPSQGILFEETEDYTEAEIAEAEQETIVVASHKKKKVGRKPLSDKLPRKDIIHDISDEEKQCACGCQLSNIDKEISERLQIIPEQVFVERHIRLKYACRNCEGSGDEEKAVFRIAPAPPTVIPGSIVTAGLFAFILINKFADHLPYYRQEKRFERIGVKLSRQVMSNWTVKLPEILRFLLELMAEEIKKGPYIQMDETPVQVLNEPMRTNTQKSYMWLARGGPPETPIILYDYQATRSSTYAKDFLEGYEGFLQTDGYVGYDAALKNNSKITHVGCLAHARRKFHEATKGKKKAGSAHEAISKIKKIYRQERELGNQGFSGNKLLIARKEKVLPLLEDLKTWLDIKKDKVVPSSLTGKAISYTLGQWDKIIRYLDCPELTPDTNRAENAIRPFVVGRKNWLFSGSPRGANGSCLAFSLIETAKQNGLNPYGYLKYIFEKVPLLTHKEEFRQLLPWNVDREEVKRYAFNGW